MTQTMELYRIFLQCKLCGYKQTLDKMVIMDQAIEKTLEYENTLSQTKEIHCPKCKQVLDVHNRHLIMELDIIPEELKHDRN